MPHQTYPTPDGILQQLWLVARASHASRPLLVLMLVLFASDRLLAAPAQNPAVAGAARTTIAIFSDRPMPAQLWPALADALEQEIAEEAPDQPAIAAENADRPIQIVRGDAIRPGIVVDKSIVVFVHGECEASPVPNPPVFPQRVGPHVLGWAESRKGKIAPFIHVECAHIRQVLRAQEIGSTSDLRNQQTATAMARVIMHEWLHIATQNPHHAKHGLFKAQLSVTDLVARRPRPSNRQETSMRNGD